MIAALALRLRILAVALRRSGVRAVLAIGAVGLGTAATVLTLALAAGAERELEAVAAQVGRDLLVVSAAPVRALPGRGRGVYLSPRLDRDDVATLRSGAASLAAVVPLLEGSFRAVLGRQATTTTVRGVPPELLPLRRYDVVAGRGIEAADEAERRRVAVVGPTVAARLGRGASLLGRTLRIGGVPFEVVGELAAKGISPDGQNEDDQVLVPLETARRRLFARESLSRLVVQATRGERMAAAERELRAVLRETHRLGEGVRDDFEIVSLVRSNEIRRRSGEFLRGMSRLFAATAVGVGAVGVLVVGFLNVKDRTPEIGLRMAIGARRRDVARLFVAESCLLGLLGGLAGLLAGVLAVALLARTVGWRMAIDLRAALAPLALSLVVGLVSGWWPARRAARVAPIAALRDA